MRLTVLNTPQRPISESLASMLRGLITKGQSKLDDKFKVSKRFPKHVKSAEGLPDSLLSKKPDSLRWWEEILNEFGVPKEKQSKIYGGLLKEIDPSINTEAENPQLVQRLIQQGRNMERRSSSRGRGRGRGRGGSYERHETHRTTRRTRNRDDRDDVDDIDDEDLTEGSSKFSKMLDMLSPVKRLKMGAKYVRKSNNQRIAILAMNELLKMGYTPKKK